MSTSRLRREWDYSDYARFPDDGSRYEVIDGEVLVTPSASPGHQRISYLVAAALDVYVGRYGLGMMLQDVDLLFRTGQFLRPDLVVVPVSSGPGITKRGIEIAPLLVVEILSPTSDAIDLVKKPARYGDFGIPEYWVLDSEERCAWVWRFAVGHTAPERVTGKLTWHPKGAAEPLTLDLDALLAPL